VIQDRPNRTNAEAGAGGSSLPKRVRTWLGMGGEPPLHHPRSARLEPIRRSWAAAFWQARIAVNAGVPLDDWVRSRLARYLAELPVARSRLPLAVEVDDGELHVGPTEPERRKAPPAPDDQDAWLAALVAAEGPTARQEVIELEVRLSVLDGEAEVARRRSEELSRRLGADVSSGLVAAPATVEATAEQLGRPVVRSVGPVLAVGGFALLAVAAETWQIAAPILRSAGVDPSPFAAEAAKRPVDAVFAAGFGFGVAVAIFALAHAGLEAAITGYRGEDDVRRRRWLGATGAGAAALAGLVAAAVASLPSPAAALPPWTLVLLLVALPLATAILLRRARGWAAARAEEAGAALAWDRERARALADRARRIEELEWAEDEERAIERQREAARRRLREISARAIEATRIGAEAERRERAALARLAQSLVGALELDRFEFVRQASARGATELTAPRRRKMAPEGRAATSLLDSAPAAVAAAAGVGEPGRLAS
jgi:hypothetical protein